MNRFIILQVGYNYYALPCALAATPIMQALPHLQKVEQDYQNGKTIYLIKEENLDVTVSFSSVMVEQTVVQQVAEQPVPKPVSPSFDDDIVF